MPGNEEQIPLYVSYVVLVSLSFDEILSSAYELYADLPPKESPQEANGPEERLTKSQKKAKKSTNMAKRFKDTFSRPNVRVHFIGVWCVSNLFCVHASLTTSGTGIPSLLSG